MNIPIYNCLIDEKADDESGIYAMSFVDCPANEIDFIKLNKQQEIYLNKDPQKQILTGVVLRPDQLIYRNDHKTGEYYIKFSAEQIEKIAQKMMRTGIALHNTTHQHQNTLKGNYLTELWIIENSENDKSKALGFSDLPKGTLMCSYKIEDKQYWNTQVMTGNVRGFSLEGLFFQKAEVKKTKQKNNNQNEKMNKTRKKNENLFSRICQFFSEIQAVEESDVTQSGNTYIIFTLADGKEVYVDKDGFATLEGEQLPAGEHPLSDGNTLVVDEDGQLIETKEASTISSESNQISAPESLQNQESANTLKQKIADLEARLSELAELAKEANAEVQNLRKKTPSSQPLSPHTVNRRFSEMKRYEQMAQALSLSIKNKLNK